MFSGVTVSTFEGMESVYLADLDQSFIAVIE